MVRYGLDGPHSRALEAPLSDLLRSEKDPITKDTMYPPLAEVKRLAISKADELSRATWVTRKRPRAPS